MVFYLANGLFWVDVTFNLLECSPEELMCSPSSSSFPFHLMPLLITPNEAHDLDACTLLPYFANASIAIMAHAAGPF